MFSKIFNMSISEDHSHSVGTVIFAEPLIGLEVYMEVGTNRIKYACLHQLWRAE